MHNIFDYLVFRPYQLKLPIFTPKYKINKEFLTTLPVAWALTRTETDSTYSIHSTVDHPAFADLRRHLSDKKYIHMDTSSWNSDKVLRKFYLNEVLFDVGDKFPSAGAMWCLKTQ